MVDLQRKGVKTEEQETPNFWKWMLMGLIAAVLIAGVLSGIFYYFRGRKESRPPSGVPQTRLVFSINA